MMLCPDFPSWLGAVIYAFAAVGVVAIASVLIALFDRSEMDGY